MNNIVVICPKCSDEIKVKTQQNINEKISKLLKDKIEKIWFKVKLTSGEMNEHVWVRVIDVNIKDETFYGIIDNDICIVGDKYACGDGIVMSFCEIEQII